MKQILFTLLLCICSFLLAQTDNSLSKDLIKVDFSPTYIGKYNGIPVVYPYMGFQYESFLSDKISIQAGFQIAVSKHVYGPAILEECISPTNCPHGNELTTKEVYLQVPLQVKYHFWQGKKYSLVPSIALMGEKIVGQELWYMRYFADGQKILTDVFPYPSNLYSLHGGIGLALEHHLSKKWMMYIEPSAWSPFLKAPYYSSRYAMLKFGVGYKL